MICAVIFMGGIQLFCMGIMGQYVAKIYMESKHRPHYIIAESSREGTKKLDECRKVFLFWFIQGNRNISLLHNEKKFCLMPYIE